MITTYVARRRLKVGPDLYREPEDQKHGIKGDLVPEVVLWTRWESFLHTGYIGTIEVTEAEFEAALAAAVPPLEDWQAERVREHHGLGDAYGLHGPHKMPFTRTQVLKDAERARKNLEQYHDTIQLSGPVPAALNPPPKPPRNVLQAKPVKRPPRVRPFKVVAAAPGE